MPATRARQKAYSTMRGDRDVYTPQIVINGIAQALGSDKSAIERAMTQSRRNAAILSVPVTLSIDKDAVTVKASAKETDARTAEVWLCPLTRNVQVQIGRGENRGKTVTYTNVVRGWIKLGTWTGKEETWKVPIGESGIRRRRCARRARPERHARQAGRDDRRGAGGDPLTSSVDEARNGGGTAIRRARAQARTTGRLEIRGGIGIGARGFSPRPLPHHPACGSAPGGSLG